VITLGAISDPFCFVQALDPLHSKSLPQNGGAGGEVILPYQGRSLGRVRHLGPSRSQTCCSRSFLSRRMNSVNAPLSDKADRTTTPPVQWCGLSIVWIGRALTCPPSRAAYPVAPPPLHTGRVRSCASPFWGTGYTFRTLPSYASVTITCTLHPNSVRCSCFHSTTNPTHHSIGIPSVDRTIRSTLKTASSGSIRRTPATSDGAAHPIPRPLRSRRHRNLEPDHAHNA
jgi:hypothetical protein